ncbi:HSCARG dehydrogenase [Paraphoma chrysanthemicola]|uniref:HSCARG dehydrogenase n=1 Tax=Paraphoma chrysanthemicola TaxID=798071 RepID=A0A8K0R5K6_9PLEO|nr:HSCARG dehydrogenase [Paraphoma chrysanthemicola]
MSKKTLAIFGATGQQGSSLTSHIHSSPTLTSTYSLRLISRTPASPVALALSDRYGPDNITLVHGDATILSSLLTALAGVDVVFAMNAPVFGPDRFNVEYSMGRNMCDAAITCGVSYFIFSTLPSVRDMSSGQFTAVTPFDAKAATEAYIRKRCEEDGVSMKCAFVSPGMFMQNFGAQGFLNPRRVGAGEYGGNEEEVWALQRPFPASNKMPYIDAVADVGKFVGAILAAPDKFAGVTMLASQGLYTQDEIVAAIVKTTGKKVVYQQVSVEEFAKIIEFLGGFAEIFVEGFQAQAMYGYYGLGTDEKVAWAAEQAETQGRLTTLEEYLEKNPVFLAREDDQRKGPDL